MVNHPLEGKQEASIKCMDMAARVKLYGTDPIFIFDPDNKTNRPVPVFMITPIFITVVSAAVERFVYQVFYSRIKQSKQACN